MFFLIQGGAHITSMFYIPRIGTLILGMSRHESSYLLSAIGVSNVIGRLTVGFVVDKKVASSLIIFAVGCLGCAICCVLYPFTQNCKLLKKLYKLYQIFKLNQRSI